MEIFEQLQEQGLDESSILGLKTEFNQMVTEKAELKIDEATRKIQLTESEKYETQLAEAKVELKQSMISVYDEKMVDLEERLTESLNTFLDIEISEKISDEKLNEIAINETLVPLFSEMRSLFENKYVDMDTSGANLLIGAKDSIIELENKVSGEISEKMELQVELDNTKAKLIISEKTAGLTENQSERVVDFLEGKGLAEVTKQIDSLVEVISEQTDSVENYGEQFNENFDAGNADNNSLYEHEELEAPQLNESSNYGMDESLQAAIDNAM